MVNSIFAYLQMKVLTSKLSCVLAEVIWKLLMPLCPHGLDAMITTQKFEDLTLLDRTRHEK
jgi:hypothetical protein